jgi:hypothetical protein
VAVIDPSLQDSHPGGQQPSSGSFGSSLQKEKQSAPWGIQIGEWLQSLVDVHVQLFNHANKRTSGEGKSSAGVPDGQQQDHDASAKSFDEILLFSQHLLRVICNLYSRGSRNTSHT